MNIENDTFLFDTILNCTTSLLILALLITFSQTLFIIAASFVAFNTFCRVSINIYSWGTNYKSELALRILYTLRVYSYLFSFTYPILCIIYQKDNGFLSAVRSFIIFCITILVLWIPFAVPFPGALPLAMLILLLLLLHYIWGRISLPANNRMISF